MAIKSRNVLKAWFSQGKFPTGEQFSDWIDSFFHKSEDVAGVLAWVAPPLTSTSSGTAGQIARDADYLYVCIATNVWRRVTLTDF